MKGIAPRQERLLTEYIRDCWQAILTWSERFVSTRFRMFKVTILIAGGVDFENLKGNIPWLTSANFTIRFSRS